MPASKSSKIRSARQSASRNCLAFILIPAEQRVQRSSLLPSCNRLKFSPSSPPRHSSTLEGVIVIKLSTKRVEASRFSRLNKLLTPHDEVSSYRIADPNDAQVGSDKDPMTSRRERVPRRSSSPSSFVSSPRSEKDQGLGHGQ